MDALPTEILALIASRDAPDYAAYYALVRAVPRFARLVARNAAAWRNMFVVEQRNEDDLITWTLNGRLHREFDLPAVIEPEHGLQTWYQFGRRHRGNDLPAVIHQGKYVDERRCEWWIDGVKHRGDDKPAVVWEDGACLWVQHGLTHRIDDKPAFVYPKNYILWRRYGVLHRWMKPAFIYYKGSEEYWLFGCRVYKGFLGLFLSHEGRLHTIIKTTAVSGLISALTYYFTEPAASIFGQPNPFIIGVFSAVVANVLVHKIEDR